MESTEALLKDINSFRNKLAKKLPQKVQSAIAVSQRLELTTSEQLDTLKNARKTELKKLALQWNKSEEDLAVLRDLLLELRNNIRLMPQYMTSAERDALEKGKMAIEDATLDFDSRAGRNVIVKLYMPMVLKVATQMVAKSGKLNKEDLISVGLEALTRAMNSYKEEYQELLKKGKNMSFGSYARQKVVWDIEEEIRKYSNSFSGGNHYAFKKAKEEGSEGDFYADSIDNFRASNGDDIQHDRIAALGVHQDHKPDREQELQNLYKGLEAKFSQRDVDIFYRYFGINDRDKETGKDIGIHYGISGGAVTQTITKILKYIKTSPKIADTLDALRDTFMENLLFDLRDCKAQVIKESLINDDIYILFEQMYRFKDRKTFFKAYDSSIKISDISDILGDFNSMDGALKLRKKEIQAFLSNMYPTENISMKTDVDLLELLQEVSQYLKQYGILENAEENGESIESLDDFKELAKNKFKEVFGDKLDKERMEFTIKGFLKSNKKDVEEENWGSLVGKFNQSFAMKENLMESLGISTADYVCRTYNTFWGTPTDSLMYLENGTRYVNNWQAFERILYSTRIAAYDVSQSGYINLAAFLEANELAWARVGDKILVDHKDVVVMKSKVDTYIINGEKRNIAELGVLPIQGQTLDSYGQSLRQLGMPFQQVGEMLVAHIGQNELIVEALERVEFKELEELCKAKLGDIYVVKARKGYRLASDDKKWIRVLKTPFNYLPVDFDDLTAEDQFEIVMDVIRTIS